MPKPVKNLEEFMFLAATQAAMNLGVRHVTADWKLICNAADFMDEVDADRTPIISSDDANAIDCAAFSREVRWIYSLLAQWGYVVGVDDVVFLNPMKPFSRDVFRAVAGVVEISNRLREIRETEDQA